MTDVSILGTGLMGAAIARTLLREGMSVTVWNRTPDKAEALRIDGATVAGTATEALQASPISVFVIFSYDNVRAILEAAIADGPIGQVVNLVTGKPTDGKELAVWATDHGVEVIDGAILAYPDGIGEADSVLVFAGNGSLWSERKDLLTLLGGASTYLGDDMSLANTMDHVALNFLTTTQTALFETLAYAEGGPRRSRCVGLHRALHPDGCGLSEVRPTDARVRGLHHGRSNDRHLGDVQPVPRGIGAGRRSTGPHHPRRRGDDPRGAAGGTRILRPCRRLQGRARASRTEPCRVSHRRWNRRLPTMNGEQ